MMLDITPDEAWAIKLRAKYGIAAPMAPPTEADNDDDDNALTDKDGFVLYGDYADEELNMENNDE